ncbi:hypothetical protein [Pontibacter akesuensis]|uniref:Uncharacterized protein n=1 Tax=Pontibacter akesuensis TaxID=388950 RepID=A0A1I7KL19_9BACT|nr:hypothetical protein [Pontibacter akesuensis]GHA78043.1 hypothetical protein GCM10007389_34900 [Pontibacter akesuensis]SFU98139.1 hypothetical protein SAMN04487941_3820 [Pontibacter akesuensis]
MNSVKLSANYRLYAFSDYQSMKAALPYMRSVKLAKRFTELEEQEIRGFVWRSSGQGYTNYLNPISTHRAKPSAMDSFITALQLLYKSNGYSARYVVVERG